MLSIQDFKSGFHIGMHGLGMLHGIPHTNSLEALRFWRKKNIRFFEVDIAATDDKQFILLSHNAAKKDLEKLEVFKAPLDGKYSLNWFRGIRTCEKSIDNGLMINTLEEFLSFVAKDEQIVAMIDPYGRSFDEIEQIAGLITEYEKKHNNFLERILLELYTLNDVKKIQNYNRNIHIIACVKEDKYNFWGEKKDISALSEVDFISCKWKYINDEREVLDYCKLHNIGILSLSRFDNNITAKKKAGININLVDVYGKGKYAIYLENILQFCYHLMVIWIHRKTN